MAVDDVLIMGGDMSLILRAVLQELAQNEWDDRYSPGGFGGAPSTDMFMDAVISRVPDHLQAYIRQEIDAFVVELATKGLVPHSLRVRRW